MMSINIFRLVKLFLIYTPIFFVCLLSYAYQGKIVAYVNDDVITLYDLENRVNLTEAINKEKISSSDKKEILQTLIDEKLLFQIAKRNDISIPQQQVELYVNEIVKDNGFANINQLVAHYKINQKELMKQIEAQLLLRKFIETQVKPETKVSKQEIADNIGVISTNIAHRTKAKIYEIVFYKDKVSQDDILQLINNVYFQFQKGASFEDVAKQFSQSSSASEGGLIGFVELDQLSKPIADALKGKLEKFKAGYITHPIEMDNSIIIIKLADIKKDELTHKQLSEKEVQNILYNKKLAVNLRNFVSKLRQSSYINLPKP